MSKGKEEMRKALSSLSFTEKVKILEKLRDRSLSLGAWRLRLQAYLAHKDKRVELNE